MKKYRILHIPTGIFYDLRCSFCKEKFNEKALLRNVKGDVCDKMWMNYCDLQCSKCLWAVNTAVYSDNEFDIQEIE